METLPGTVLTSLAAVVGGQHVLTGEAAAGFAVDWTGRFRGHAAAVVRPRDTAEVAAVLALCTDAGVPVVPQGGNTGLVGGGVPLHGEVVLSIARLNQMSAVDRAASQVTAGAGATLRQVADADPGLDLGIQIASGDTATVGGAVATNAGGVRVLRYGPMRAQLRGIEAVLADGAVVSHLAGLTKDNTGYDYPSLLAGSEGTLAVITRARLRLVPRLRDTVTAIVGLGSLEELHALAQQAIREVPGLVSAEFFTPAGLDILVEHAGLVPPLAAPAQEYLLLEASGASALDDLAAVIADRDVAVGESAAERRRLWTYRERQPEAAGFLGVPIKLDVSVPAAHWARLASAAADVVAAVDPGATVITFGHVADGNVHVNIVPAGAADGRHENAVFSFVASLGGSISAEHGIGALKAQWLELARTPAERDLFARIRTAFDPSGTLNPHVLPRLPPLSAHLSAHRTAPAPRSGPKLTRAGPAARPTIGRMPGYEPVDLSAACNAGVDVLGDEPGDVPLGKVDLRGLPFLIGSEPSSAERCFLLPAVPTPVGIGRNARRVIVAHRLLEPGAPAGHAVGRTVAEYVFHLAGGEVATAGIRERFEIQVVPPGWGRLPFLAVTDTSDGNRPRFQGRWGEAGYRLVEHSMGWPAGYFLWCWENPHPDRAVERIEFIPRGARFIVAGVTTSDVDEHPFVRAPARPVRLVTKDGRNGVLDIDVDRGVATYPQPLPGEDDRAGWGATGGAAAYTSIAALPSATVAVRRGGGDLGQVRWGDMERDGRADAGQVTLELVEAGRNWVHVSVVDDATGRPVPCRVHFRSAAGIPYQPHGHHNHVTQNLDSWHYDVGGDTRLGQRSYAYIDGTCQGWLPRGDVVADVARGFEYEPLRQTVRIEPGQRDLTLRIRRVADMASDGWWSGDSHVHFLSTPGAQLEQRGEDLRVVNLLQTQWGALFTNTEDFSGRPSVVDGGGYITYVGQENRQHMLGHMVLWGLKEPVMPWCSDGPDEAELGGALDATMSDWADRTHAQGGTVVAAHFPNPNGEPAVLVATGRADAVEMLAHSGDATSEYYRYLNSGYRLPLVGGTDKMSSAVPVGLYRTYARLDEEFSYEAWCRAVRSGRTFLSGGPLVTLSVDGREAGDTVELSGPGTVSVHAAVRSVFPLRSLEVVHNGEVVARAEANGGRQAGISEELRVDGNSWIACRAFGVDFHLDEWGRRVFAHTSPVYVACGGDWAMSDPEGIRYIRTLVEGTRDYVRHTAVRRPDQVTTHHHGEADHLAWLERPFAEALRALEGRGGE